MPRPKKPGAEPKRRSRFGCHNCKRRKVKCGEEKPTCSNCNKTGETCDYSIILNWEGRTKKKPQEGPSIPPTGTPLPPTSYPFAPALSWSTNTTLSREKAVARPVSSSSGYYEGNSPPANRPTSQRSFGPSFTASGFNAGSFGQFQTLSDPTDISERRQGKRRRVDEDTSVLTSSTPDSAFSPFSPPPYRVGQKRKSYMTDIDQFAMYSTEVPADGCPASTPATPGTTYAAIEGTPGDENQGRHGFLAEYGFDRGRDDLDIPINDDVSALSMSYLDLPTPNFHRQSSSSESETDPAFGFGLETTRETLQRSSYYSRPVTVSISREFQPLPPLLLRNPMNLLYFHHFLNHTARCLVPHDCAENAFRTVLPQMAVQDENLMNLLLAYSANHRARLLKHDVPRQRIAQYMQQVFPRLREALSINEPIRNSTLAAAIMLSSLEIVSPNAFEIPISWSKHLTLAREMILARGGYHALRHGDKVSYFLSRWFAYLDVLGSLSGGTYDRPLTDNRRTSQCPPRPTQFTPANEHAHNAEDIDNDDEIDCFLGFTGRCIATLADVANLAKDCDQKRRHLEATTGKPEQWSPGEDDKERARPLEMYLRDIKPTTYRGCSHRQVKSNTADAAVNEAFHHAGLIHLYRRVLAYPPNHVRVQAATRGVRECLRYVEDRSVSCMIFPVFSAGCEATNPDDRAVFLACLKKVGKMGMAQARRSRDIMERVWETHRAWQELVQGEFVG